MSNRDYVHAADVFRFIDRAYPGLSNGGLARLIGRDDKRVWCMRRQKRMDFYLADHILSCLDLSFLLSTGDIPVYQVKTPPKKKEYYKPPLVKWEKTDYDHEAKLRALKKRRENQTCSVARSVPQN